MLSTSPLNSSAVRSSASRPKLHAVTFDKRSALATRKANGSLPGSKA